MKIRSSKLRKAEIKFMNPSMFKEKMKEYKLGTIEAGRKTKDITAWDIISEGTNKFTEVLCHLLGNYANDFAKIDEIT